MFYCSEDRKMSIVDCFNLKIAVTTELLRMLKPNNLIVKYLEMEFVKLKDIRRERVLELRIESQIRCTKLLPNTEKTRFYSM